MHLQLSTKVWLFTCMSVPILPAKIRPYTIPSSGPTHAADCRSRNDIWRNYHPIIAVTSFTFLYVSATGQSQTRYEPKQALMWFHTAILTLDIAYDQVGLQICYFLIITKVLLTYKKLKCVLCSSGEFYVFLLQI